MTCQHRTSINQPDLNTNNYIYFITNITLRVLKKDCLKNIVIPTAVAILVRPVDARFDYFKYTINNG